MKKGKGVIHFPQGTAFVIKNGQQERVESLETQTCDCYIDFCDCALIMSDLDTGNKFALYFLDGALAFSAIADFEAYKESGDVADLNETVIAEV